MKLFKIQPTNYVIVINSLVLEGLFIIVPKFELEKWSAPAHCFVNVNVNSAHARYVTKVLFLVL